MSTLKKKQHYVWKYYLKSWVFGGKIYCFRKTDGKLFGSSPNSNASETFFYRAYRLTHEDREFLEGIISMSPDDRHRQINRNFVTMFQASFELQDSIRVLPIGSEARLAAERVLAEIEKNLGENFHATIEQNSQELLDHLLKENDSIVMSIEGATKFYFFIANQFFRTPKLQSLLSNISTSIPGLDRRRTRIIESYIYANNIGSALFSERNIYKINFLRNVSADPLLTSDQPVINLTDHTVPDVELYYPLSPALAIVVSKNRLKYPNRVLELKESDVRKLNVEMFDQSYDQIYTTTKIT